MSDYVFIDQGDDEDGDDQEVERPRHVPRRQERFSNVVPLPTARKRATLHQIHSAVSEEDEDVELPTATPPSSTGTPIHPQGPRIVPPMPPEPPPASPEAPEPESRGQGALLISRPNPMLQLIIGAGLVAGAYFVSKALRRQDVLAAIIDAAESEGEEEGEEGLGTDPRERAAKAGDPRFKEKFDGIDDEGDYSEPLEVVEAEAVSDEVTAINGASTLNESAPDGDEEE